MGDKSYDPWSWEPDAEESRTGFQLSNSVENIWPNVVTIVLGIDLKKEMSGLLPPPPPLCLLSLCPFTTITATGRPWQPETLILSLRSSSMSSAVLKSCPSHKGKPLVYNGPWPDVRFCG